MPTATRKYFNFNPQTGSFEEADIDVGLLPGWEWESQGITYRSIMTIPNFTMLKDKSLGYEYWVFVKLPGEIEWFNQPRRKEYVPILDSQFIEVSSGLVVGPDAAYGQTEEGVPYLKEGYYPQLSYFINLIGKGLYGIDHPPLFDLMLKEIANMEGLVWDVA